MRCSINLINHPWSMVSKNPRMSASSTQFTFLPIIQESTSTRQATVMRSTSWPEAVVRSRGSHSRRSHSYHRHHSTLKDLILQRCDAQRPLPAIRFGDVHSPRGFRPIRAAVRSGMERPKVVLQLLAIVLPASTRHPAPLRHASSALKYASRGRSTSTVYGSAVNRFFLSAFAALRTRSSALGALPF